jgi:hypothetical protein
LKHQHVCGRHDSVLKRVRGWRRRIDEVASPTDTCVGRVALSRAWSYVVHVVILLSSCSTGGQQRRQARGRLASRAVGGVRSVSKPYLGGGVEEVLWV